MSRSATATIHLDALRANLARVRSLAGDRSVLHFATHGVIRADDPLESFLALDTGRIVAANNYFLGGVPNVFGLDAPNMAQRWQAEANGSVVASPLLTADGIRRAAAAL